MPPTFNKCHRQVVKALRRGFLDLPCYMILLGFLLCAGVTGCQLVDQAVEITNFNLNSPTPIPVERALWTALTRPNGPATTGHSGAILSIKAIGSPVSGLYTVGTDRKILYWDLASGKATIVRQLATTDAPSVATFGTKYALVTYSSGNSLAVECINDCNRTWRANNLRARAKAIDFHNNDSAILVGSVDGKVTRWRFIKADEALSTAERDKCFELYTGHQTVVSAVASHPFNRAFFTGDWSGSFYAWLPYDSDDFKGEYDKNLFTSHFYAAPGTFTKGLREVDRGVVSLAVSTDGNRLVLGSENGFVETWAVRGFERESRLEAHKGRVLSVDTSPSGERIATIGRDGNVRLFALEDDPMFGISAEATKKRLLEVASYQVSEGLVLKYISENSVVVGTSTGKLIEADASGPAIEPTPTPEPENRMPEELDTDY